MKVLIILCFVAFASANERIINGNDAVSMEATPWQASLQRSGSHFCGGSVIAEMFIMTACHCLQTDVTVNVGSINYQSPQQTIPVDSFTCNPNWRQLIIDFDYAVIKLVAPLTLNPNVQPIALPASGQEFPGGTPALISGWGLTVGGGDTLPTTLQWANTQLVDPADCLELLGKTITPRMQCAGLLGNTACNGDSGGPLAVQDADGTWLLVGNTSFGVVNCPTQAASVWSKNSAVIDWINEEMAK